MAWGELGALAKLLCQWQHYCTSTPTYTQCAVCGIIVTAQCVYVLQCAVVLPGHSSNIHGTGLGRTLFEQSVGTRLGCEFGAVALAIIPQRFSRSWLGAGTEQTIIETSIIICEYLCIDRCQKTKKTSNIIQIKSIYFLIIIRFFSSHYLIVL